MFFRRHSPDDKMTEAQYERMLTLTVSGEPEGPTLWRAKTHLEYACTLVESGRIGHDDEASDDC